MKSRVEAIIVGGFACIGWGSVQAYIDPGTGSALIQGLIAAVAAVGVTLKLYWHRITNFFKSDKGGDQETEDDVESDR